MNIRLAQPQDDDGIWAVLEPMVRAGDSYTLPRDWSRAQTLAYWMGEGMTVFVAEESDTVLGTYYIRANYKGGGAHTANCGYVVHPNAEGRGLARKMAEHSIAAAQAYGFRAMQFNFVIATNHAALKLWPSLGFEKIGCIPQAFNHPTDGFVDAYIFHRAL
ncbi:MAG: GNAT family N-acetyltransferase [Pseudomonadota bacterium]